MFPTVNQGLGMHQYLVGGFNPFDKHDRQNGNLPQVAMNINNIWNHTV